MAIFKIYFLIPNLTLHIGTEAVHGMDGLPGQFKPFLLKY